jgi:LysR family transcriptional regulator, low CO2-responsive transcriptional regulator
MASDPKGQLRRERLRLCDAKENMLNLSWVRTFVTLIETKSFVDTARRLQMAQPTVSLQLKKLEASLGVSLVERSHSGCNPTARGRALFPYAEALLRSADRFETAVARDHIVIGCSGNIASYYITRDLKRFVDSAGAGIAWDIRTATNPEVGDLLAAGAVDLAAMEWSDRRKEFELRPWRVEPMVVIVPNDHRLAKARSISVDEFMELEFIGGEPGSGTGTVLRRALGRRAAKLRISHTLHSTEAVKSAVEAGLGSSIVLKGAVRDEVQSGNFAMLSLKGVKLEKVFHLAFRAGLPETALPVRLAHFLSN